MTMNLRDNIYFTLVQPRESGNVGAAARAIKNMGFERLCLVDPCDYLNAEARAFAHGAIDVLEGATVCANLTEAVSDKAIVIGTTRRQGKTRGVIRPVKEAVATIAELANNNKVAILFGREDKGLLSEEINRCGFLMTIATSHAQPSLNLAQAVLIVAYELSPVCRNNHCARTPKLVPQEHLNHLYDRIAEVLRNLDISMRGSEDLESDIVRNIRHLVGRYGLTHWEVDMLHGICSAINNKCKRSG
ncbi:RNA methyltransferase [Candidatus Magnetobacterium casense]|uniref:tRNA (cytidine/uridine-2'-O-)-methyltransferase TrmJ n=1 Tax=Candidatus Magnetobacterium casense TaxID=1455061 RepID=A0ABS6RX44_9BACT|nr:TrmJ/YjtD family RNA methyltransferase [Candidatus Magnetobacterium casensis]MBV6341204.1 TrmJ/YjtD family RNA methyltransferase [Candidatus Magnetobacterium casensis]